jgi:hypothetical protein
MLPHKRKHLSRNVLAQSEQNELARLVDQSMADRFWL